ncbi:hypothetical protein [Aquirhabdus sp.]|uniref:hypothetical protein n=1 Tax=Aquirhabdus sp. TaxID=2824160 RepID=UPI00396D057C
MRSCEGSQSLFPSRLITVINILLLSTCLTACNRDPINKVLDHADNVPDSAKDRGVKWYQSHANLGKDVSQACDTNPAKYYLRTDCINSKNAMTQNLLNSDADLSNNPELDELRAELRAIKAQHKSPS